MAVGPLPPALRGYIIAGSLVALALAFGLLLGPDVEVRLAPLLFIAAGMLAAWFGGPGPGLAAVLLSTLLVEYIWVEPRFSLAIDPGQLPWFLAFCLTGLVAMGLSLQRRRYEGELAAARDRLEKRMVERTAQLQFSEERWRRLFETSSVGIALTEPDGRFLQANRALQAMLGYDEASLRRISLGDLIEEGVAPPSLPEGGGAGETVSELPLRRRDGGIVWVGLSLSAIPASDHMPALASAVMIDVSERRRATEDWQRAQAELSRASRLTTMGVLAASIAHQVNQPLSAVVTNGQAAQRWMRSTPPNLAEAGAALERMIREGNRAAEIIRSIRQVLAPAGGARHRLSLHDVIRQTLTLIDTELASQRVALRLDLAAPSDEIVGDAVQLQQLLLNLLINALDSLRAAHRPAPWLRLATRQSGGNLQVTVEDNGCGLSPEIEPDRLFEPFYGTKPESMGVGLAICHSVVESHGGRIWAEPRPAEGAAFSFTLPLADEESSFGEGRAAES